MCSLLTSKSLALLLLLLQPLPLQVLMLQRQYGETEETIDDIIDEMYTIRPAKPPTKESFQNRVLLNAADYKYYEFSLCTAEMKSRNIHTNLHCHKKHIFLNIAYEELQKTCYTGFVKCENGVRKCHMTSRPIEGAYCEFTGGPRIPACEYETTFKKGYALITCRWQDDIGEIIPAYVNSILEIPGK